MNKYGPFFFFTTNLTKQYLKDVMETDTPSIGSTCLCLTSKAMQVIQHVHSCGGNPGWTINIQ